MSSIPIPLEGTPCGCGFWVVTLKGTRSIISGQVKSTNPGLTVTDRSVFQ